MEHYVRLDLAHLAQGLTIVFDSDHDAILASMMPWHLYDIIQDVKPVIDHVGRELFGPLDFYLELLDRYAAAVGLVHVALPPGPNVTEKGDAVFQSVQVVEALRQFDPDLEGVTIGKICFSAVDEPQTTGCLELFQPALRDGLAPQCHRHTVERMHNLHSDKATEGPVTDLSLQPPVCHLSIEAADVATVFELHEVAQRDTSGMLMPYVDRVVENTGDGSTNTKISIRSRPDSPVYNKIIEIVHLRD